MVDVLWKGSSVGLLHPLLHEDNVRETDIQAHCYFFAGL